jgi:hypothetical protein
MTGHIDVSASHRSDADHHGIEALDQADGVSIWLVRIKHR